MYDIQIAFGNRILKEICNKSTNKLIKVGLDFEYLVANGFS